MKKAFTLFLATPERKVYEKEVSSVTLPVIEGEITVLADHIPYIGALKSGELCVRSGENNVEYVALSSGFVEFNANTLTVLVDTAERSEEIDEHRVEEAIRKAQEAKEQKNINEEEYAILVARLEKEFARLRVLRRRR